MDKQPPYDSGTKSFDQAPNGFNAKEFIEHRKQTSDKLDVLVQKIEALIDPGAPLEDQVQIFLSLPEEDRLYLWEFKDDSEVAKAAVLGIQAVRGLKRKSGRSYASHSKQVALTCLEIATDIPAPVRKRTAMVGEIHDVGEEDTVKALKGKKEQSLNLADLSQPNLTEEGVIGQAKSGLNELFPGTEIGEAMVMIMEPQIPQASMDKFKSEGADTYLIEYSYFAQLLKKSGDPGVINAEIADRIDDILDITYITENPKLDDPTKKQKLLDKFGKCQFTRLLSK